MQQAKNNYSFVEKAGAKICEDIAPEICTFISIFSNVSIFFDDYSLIIDNNF